MCGQLMGALRESFSREVAEALRRSRHLALMNGLRGFEGDEETAAGLRGAFEAAHDEFMSGAPATELPPWSALIRRDPGGVHTLLRALTPRAGAVPPLRKKSSSR